MLYKKYKPETLQDFLGMDSILHKMQPLPQCLCLEGEPGRGKSALAWVLARNRICENHTACGNCGACKNHDVYIDRVNSSDIDIAKMRDITSRYGSDNPFLPGDRVLILEEFQELYKAKAAMNNALLLFESLPESVTVILTTMDSSKMNMALKRRFVMVTMPRVDEEVITRYLKNIAVAEKKDVPDIVIAAVAEFCDGSIGVALSLLESYFATGDLPVRPQTELRERVKQILNRDPEAMKWGQAFDSENARALRAYMTNAIFRSKKQVPKDYLKIYFMLGDACDSYGPDSRDRWRSLFLRLFYRDD